MKKVKAFLLRLLTKKKHTPFSMREIESIVIFRYDRIGDMVVSLPLIKELKTRIPQAKLTVITSQSNDCIAKLSPFIDETIIKPQSFFSWLLILNRIRKRKNLLVVDLNHSVATHTLLATIFIRPSHATSPYKDGRWGVKGTELEIFDLMPPEHPQKYNRPISMIYLDIAQHITGHKTESPYYELPTTSTTNKTKPYVVINVIGSRQSMRIADADLIRVCKLIGRDFSAYQIYVISLSTNYQELRSVLSGLKDVEILPPTDSIAPVLPLVEHSELVITPDTALVHIASAYNKKLIAVYTNDLALFKHWQPINTNETYIIYSSQPKSLSGYSSDELYFAVLKALSTT